MRDSAVILTLASSEVVGPRRSPTVDGRARGALRRGWAGWLVWLGLVAISSGIGAVQSVDYPSIADWARLEDETQAHYVSSYDRSGGNDDGFNGTFSSLYSETTARGLEYVIVDASGPGCLYTLWFTSRKSGFAPLDVGRLRFYLDEDNAPRLDVDANEFFSGGVAPFDSPLVFSPFQSSGGHVSYVPRLLRPAIEDFDLATGRVLQRLLCDLPSRP